ncbi:MAG: phytanoyl-CoA dioxygenase family protein [Bacteriovoracaceae bacterium]|nr:phytanoyl-CoA dioxygenase family protein [Bacteriovoracaceae bacterium]
MPQPSYNIYFEKENIEDAVKCVNEHGYCVIKNILDKNLLKELKNSIEDLLDPSNDFEDGGFSFYPSIIEDSLPVRKILEIKPYMRFMEAILGSEDLTVHRSLAILRGSGDPTGPWHTDESLREGEATLPDDVMNRFGLPNCWFYLNGSHPERHGIAVIENSHTKDWIPPEGFEFTPDKSSFHLIGEDKNSCHQDLNVPGCVEIIADPGDFICFAALTYHTNMETKMRRHSIGMALRPKILKVDAPWPLTESGKVMIENFPDHLKSYVEEYVGFDFNWRK